MPSTSVSSVKEAIRGIPDFPKPGILFRDICPVLREPALFDETLRWFEEKCQGTGVQYILGIESRGFILGAPLAQRLKIGFVPVRKRGKLPGLVERHEYDLEYGSDCIEMHTDAFPKGSRVAIVDDLLATGGTAGATITLAKKLDAQIAAVLFMVELSALNGRDKLQGVDAIHAMVDFPD